MSAAMPEALAEAHYQTVWHHLVALHALGALTPADLLAVKERVDEAIPGAFIASFHAGTALDLFGVSSELLSHMDTPEQHVKGA
ncbi:hypothetical protein BSR29_03095 [Boudabousia liubingyangii]|uniref:Uncharacterized protein n=2 Tax=Boudabousia TaxID=2767318 RepID=A0A1D9MLQ0_9ACTO|nr:MULTISPECIES: hypothetical protein [Boudabousia]AOZ73070.1 hypothetical protein BK816_07020 [Boudabousia tangfeifanii]OKL47023.1 hypothetical protein BSR28_06300 [Boudabousia liubingyangii]OKL48855.1 hypothetical protein BSR29_03095 [Boudabousia liubingyangii]